MQVRVAKRCIRLIGIQTDFDDRTDSPVKKQSSACRFEACLISQTRHRIDRLENDTSRRGTTNSVRVNYALELPVGGARPFHYRPMRIKDSSTAPLSVS